MKTIKASRKNSVINFNDFNLKEFLRENGINNENDLLRYLKENEFDWGVLDENWDKITDRLIYRKMWRLKNIQQILKDKIGICWEFANLEKIIFDELKMKSYMYWIVFDNDIDENPFHSFTLIERGDKFILFEFSFTKYAWIYELENINDVFELQFSWRFENHAHLKNKSVTIYRYDSIFPINADRNNLFNLTRSQEIVYRR